MIFTKASGRKTFGIVVLELGCNLSAVQSGSRAAKS